MSALQSERARLSLQGLSVGDAFGQQFFIPGVVEKADRENLPPSPWNYTDDTEMAMGIIQVLEKNGEIDQDLLAITFAERYVAEPWRGYGAGAMKLLRDINKGADWKKLSKDMFGGSGSYGNGGAMRVPPLGAWFANDVQETIRQAILSAEVTHAHKEGQVGTVAIALAAAWAWQRNKNGNSAPPTEMIPWILEHLEKSEVRSRIEYVATFPMDAWAFTVASQVGCGDQLSAQDTVPFCLWLAAAHIDNFCEAMWIAARVGGDIDTNCAIVGGVIALSVGHSGIPENWKKHRESLNW